MFPVHCVNFEEQESKLRGSGWEAEDAASFFFFFPLEDGPLLSLPGKIICHLSLVAGGP